ncbi:MAG TPA: HupE/UreJ family protein [Salinarimonas sp.]|nr:HupE/UreJ family protein [Salinarimonas sp.]
MRFVTLTLTLAAAATPALAHTGAGATHGFAAGVAHPLAGLDHVLAMTAVGVWAALVGGRAVWAWPAAFMALMVAGALLAFAGVPALGAEVVIALSVAALGALVALRLPLGATAGAALCGAFAVFHGLAHGAELPSGAEAGAYVTGFVLSTAALHAGGIGLGLAAGRVAPPWLPQAAGGAVAAAGLLLLVS